MKIVADENIPLVKELFAELGEVQVCSGRQISGALLHDVDALIVRSVTSVNENLLAGSQVGFVGTCTIGTDHLDKSYLEQSEIAYASAPGCNAWGVVQYVFAALVALDKLNHSSTFGIVGCGNVGGRLYRALKSMGYNCVCYDPFLNQEQVEDLCDWEKLYQCDVICVHTPLTTAGSHPTFHMLDSHFFSNMKNNALLLNAGRGAAINNASLLQHLKKHSRNEVQVVLDVWEPEPEISIELLDRVALATPHIAGYSFEGKVNGSMMIFRALCEFLGKPKSEFESVLQRVGTRVFGEPEPIYVVNIEQAIMHSYDIGADDKRMRSARNRMNDEFDILRKNYPIRREFSHYRIAECGDELKHLCISLGFNC